MVKHMSGSEPRFISDNDKTVMGITVLCHFRKNVISCLTNLKFWSLFHVLSIPFCPRNSF